MHPPGEIKAAAAENRAKRQQNDRPEDRTVIFLSKTYRNPMAGAL